MREAEYTSLTQPSIQNASSKPCQKATNGRVSLSSLPPQSHPGLWLIRHAPNESVCPGTKNRIRQAWLLEGLGAVPCNEDSGDLCRAPRWESCGSGFSDKPCIFYTFRVHSAIIAECHAIPVGSRWAVTTTASSSSIESAKILSWESEPIPAKSRQST
jgi:hypothetical protein